MDERETAPHDNGYAKTDKPDKPICVGFKGMTR